jgi:hypothetical protein
MAMWPSHRFVFAQSPGDFLRRMDAQWRAINGSRFANSPRSGRLSRRIPVNNRAIAQRMRVDVRDFRGACVTWILITFRVFACCVVQIPKILTMAPVNPHL